MWPSYVTKEKIREFINLAIREDVGDGDHSTLASIPEGAVSKAQLVFKSEGILAGISLASKIFKTIDGSLKFEPSFKDGDRFRPGDIGFVVYGNSRSILTAERLVLNCMQRMSGIATYTGHLLELIEGSGTKLLDTRKTTPNFRMMEKWAVRIGGGHNHRFGLYDMIMLKDNHIDFAGSIEKAIRSTVDYLEHSGKKLKIEVEVRTMDEVREALATGNVDRLLLDNMATDDLIQAVSLINGKAETEASGGITEETIAEIAGTGVDYISVGALTHSVKSLDMSLKAAD